MGEPWVKQALLVGRVVFWSLSLGLSLQGLGFSQGGKWLKVEELEEGCFHHSVDGEERNPRVHSASLGRLFVSGGLGVPKP